MLLTPISRLESELGARAFNVLTDKNLLVVGDLAQTTASTLSRQISFGVKSLKKVKDTLQARGLQLGTVIENWPDPDEVLRLLEERRAEGIEAEELPNSPHSCIEEELSAAVELVVPSRHHKIFFARTRWNGGQTYSLEHLGMNPDLSGLERPVTRERIRQLEAAAFCKFQGRQIGTPLLDRAISCILEATPIAVTRVPEILKNAGLSKTGMGATTLRMAAETLHKAWDLETSWVMGLIFLNQEDQNQTIAILRRIVDQTSKVDFLSVSDFENLAPQAVENSGEYIRSLVEIDPRIEWLDFDEGILWMRPSIKPNNKIKFVCQKLFSVVDELSVEHLLTALKRARTVKIFPSSRALKAMLSSWDDFDVKDHFVCRASGVKYSRLNKTDRMVLSVFGEYGTILNFTFLCNSLVRKGLSTNHANVLTVISPFIHSLSRGKYRCIAKPDQIARALDEPEPANEDIDELYGETIVELFITAKHLAVGTHRITNAEIDAGTWAVLDVESRDMGTIRTNGQKLSGLKEVFSRINVSKGDRIKIRFDLDTQSVTVTTT